MGASDPPLTHAVHPIAGDHTGGFEGMYRFRTGPCFKQVTVKPAILPMRVTASRNIFYSGAFFEQRFTGVTQSAAGPVFAVYPHAIDIIFTHDFQH